MTNRKLQIKQMIMQYSILLCMVISLILMLIATLVYPGGSLFDKNSTGFEWSKNFISNLFAEKAINGKVNSSKIWAIIGMVFHSVGYGVFFINTALRIVNYQLSIYLNKLFKNITVLKNLHRDIFLRRKVSLNF